ncbi:MAG: radical SAM protein [Dorea sp.]|nr:radical SAM protein [Dorea sp.]
MYDMKYALEEFLGKEIYGCKFLGTRLNLNPNTFSLCHEAQVGDQVLGKIEELCPENYYEALRILIERNKRKDAPCRKCDKGWSYIYEFSKINYITVCTSQYCNSRCVYCRSHFGEMDEGYDPIPYLTVFHEKELFSKDCFFDWGGGEPTLNQWFEKTVQWLNECGYYQRINTNGILYSDETELALKSGNTELRISVDSGSKECFCFMKGHNAYEQVWDHIHNYCKASDKVYVKYNVCNYNSDFREIEIFIERCKKCGVKHLIIDAEVSSYQPIKNAGPFYFSYKEFKAVHYLERLAKKEGFDVLISGYAFSVRAEFNESGNLILPQEYFDNLDYEICSHGVKVQTFPSILYMTEYIKQKKNPVVVWGGGYVGKNCINMLKTKGVLVESVIDKNMVLQGSKIQGVSVSLPQEYFSSHVDSQIILTGKYWKEMLGEINQYQYSSCAIYYMPECYYESEKNNI